MEVLVDGARAYAATGGRAFDPTRPVVVLIHGAGMDHTVWQLQTRYLAHHGRSVLAVDLPGHGRSEGAPPESIDAYADWILRFLDAVGAERAALVGHSMGALIALAVGAAAPERVDRLVLLGVAARMPVHPDLLAAARRGEPLAPELIVAWGFGREAHFGGHRAPGVWMMGGGLRLLQRAAPGVLANDLAACDAYEEAAEAAGRLACPVLLLLAADDRMTPPKGARPLAEAAADARTVVLSGCGHMAMVEAPDRVLDEIDAFLDARQG